MSGLWQVLADMPHPAGAGRWHQGILAALDGVPREANDLVREILGREPTMSEYSASNHACHVLATRGLVELSHVKDGRHRRLVLVKVPGADAVTVRMVRDRDGCSAADTEAQPVDWLRELTERAWAAFRQDPGYLEEMAAAHVAKLTEADRARLRAHLVRDGDELDGAEHGDDEVGVLDCAPELTARRAAVMELRAAGLSYRAIGAELGMAHTTARVRADSGSNP
jgi:hypothetical protein